MSFQTTGFDFQTHQHKALVAYLEVRGFYNELASVVRLIIEEALKRRSVKVDSVQARAKDAGSFAAKAALPSDDDPSKPRYADPLREITDLAGVRVIAYFHNTLSNLDELVQNEFVVLEKSNKGATLIEEERFGYQSIHYLVRLSKSRTRLPEYERFSEAIVEIQVRTILQHAWAEIEHDLQYKASSVIPTEIRRRFMALAGLFEIADREFQAIQDADRLLTAEARSRVEAGQLAAVEITPDALKAFLDQRLGPDGRIAEWSYNWTARLLKKLGFKTLEQVDTCIRGYDDDKLSRIADGSRQGQTTRFEHMLLAGMGENFARLHLYAAEPWFLERRKQVLGRLRESGVEIRNYDPNLEVEITADEGPTDWQPGGSASGSHPPTR